MIRKIIIPAAIAASLCFSAGAQTATSLFWRSDSLEVAEIVSEKAVQYSFVGHHGPAIENSRCALRIYFNDSGSIDVYSKSGRQMELAKYLWYPTEKQQAEEGAGCDEYLVGRTVGLGGIALWDGENEVKLKATRGRTARVGQIKGGSYAEMVAYGVEYMGGSVDVLIRIEMRDDSRVAKIIAKELNGKKVQFLTGVNYQKGETVQHGRNWIAVWGVHPADVSKDPSPIGAGMWFRSWKFASVDKTDNMVRLISKPTDELCTQVVAASTKEDELGTESKFVSYMRKNARSLKIQRGF